MSGPAPDQDADRLPPGIDPSGLSSRSLQRSLNIQRQFERVLAMSRLLVLIPVVFLLLDAAGSFVYGADILARSAGGDLGEAARVGGRLGIFLIVMDTFLVGVTFMIAAFGFYELFVVRRERAGHRHWLPHWLQMHDLEDLKARVTSMLILVASITFVDILVEYTRKFSSASSLTAPLLSAMNGPPLAPSSQTPLFRPHSFRPVSKNLLTTSQTLSPSQAIYSRQAYLKRIYQTQKLPFSYPLNRRQA